MAEVNGDKKMLFTVFDLVTRLAIGGLAVWVWNTNADITDMRGEIKATNTSVANVQDEAKRERLSISERLLTIYQEGTLKLRDHLQEEAASDQQMLYLKENVADIKGNVKQMQDQINQMLLLQRDLLNEVKLRSPTPERPQ